jgi:hypothetical protein
VRVEFAGTIESLTPPTLRVAGRTVMTDSNTHLHGQGQTHSLADFNVGDEVEVEGVQQPNGTVLADDIKRTEEAGH